MIILILIKFITLFLENKLSEYWGYHLHLDCGECNKELISSKENILAFTKAIIKAIDMVQYGETICEHFATHDPSKGGYTMLALIETSNLSAHFVESTGEAYIDIFSCKPFDIETAKEVVGDFFQPKTIFQNYLLRKAY